MRILICLLFSIAAVDFATAGCDINLRVKNETKYAISLEDPRKAPVRKSSFQVKTRAVPWRSVGKGGWAWDNVTRTGSATRHVGTPLGSYSVLESGKTIVDNYEAVLGCGVKRRYRVRFTCHEVVETSDGSGNLAFTDGGENMATKTRYWPGPKEWTKSRNVTIPIKSCK